jgi:RNA methyltransferase, TrmH family
MEIITSRNNPKIKEARSLRGRKGRDEQRAFLVEGIHHVGAAVEAAAELREIIYAPEYLKSTFARQLVESQAARGVPCYATTPEVFDSLADKENPQGLLAVAEQPRIEIMSLSPENFLWGAALIAPQDPGNLGTILRTVDAVGASGVLLLEWGVDAYHPAAVRASLGAIFWRPVVTASFTEFSNWARGLGYAIYGTSARGSLDYREVDSFPRPLILLLGSEREGLSPEQTKACDVILRLPMEGHVTSLNLAVAAGIFLYRILEMGG